MKKVLFATTALVASAGFASAEVALSGSAEMGIVGGDGIETQFLQSVDVSFAMTGETDNGLSFGATVDLEDAVDSAIAGNDLDDSTSFSDYTVFISGDFGTLTMGDTDGAFDRAMTETLVAGGSIADNEEAGGYSGNAGLDGIQDGQVLRYDYSFGAVAVAASVEIDDAGNDDPTWGLGATYSGDLGGVTVSAGVGFQSGEQTVTTVTSNTTFTYNNNGTVFDTTDDTVTSNTITTTASTQTSYDIWGVSLGADFGNGFEVVANYSDLDGYGGNDSHWGIGFGYTMDALAVGLNYGEFDLVGGGTQDGFGLAVEYDLGGAALQAGYGTTDVTGASSTDTWSLGVAMSF